MPGSDKPRPKSTGKEKKPAYIRKQLSAKKCNHDRKQIVTNRNGKQFEECQQCGAFLGWK